MDVLEIDLRSVLCNGKVLLQMTEAVAYTVFDFRLISEYVRELAMIISDKHRFAFIHIPKCGGTFVRGILQPFDSLAGTFTDRVDHHPEIGELDYVHIPLFVLRDYFRAEFEAIERYWSFSVVRNPYDRFASSVSQRLRQYSDKPFLKLTADEIALCVYEIIEVLSCRAGLFIILPPQYIHFQRQVDYLEVDGDRIIDSIYTLNQIDQLWADVSRHTGQSVLGGEPENERTTTNKTMVFRNDLVRHLVEAFRPASGLFRKFMSEHFKQTLRETIYVPRDKRFNDVFETEFVQTFILNYYSKDIALYRSLSRSDWRVSP